MTSPLEARRLVGHPDAVAPAAEPPAASDIVERLRECGLKHAYTWNWPEPKSDAATGHLLECAADEIVHLRSIIDRIRCASVYPDKEWGMRLIHRALQEGT